MPYPELLIFVSWIWLFCKTHKDSLCCKWTLPFRFGEFAQLVKDYLSSTLIPLWKDHYDIFLNRILIFSQRIQFYLSEGAAFNNVEEFHLEFQFSWVEEWVLQKRSLNIEIKFYSYKLFKSAKYSKVHKSY